MLKIINEEISNDDKFIIAWKQGTGKIKFMSKEGKPTSSFKKAAVFNTEKEADDFKSENRENLEYGFRHLYKVVKLKDIGGFENLNLIKYNERRAKKLDEYIKNKFNTQYLDKSHGDIEISRFFKIDFPIYLGINLESKEDESIITNCYMKQRSSYYAGEYHGSFYIPTGRRCSTDHYSLDLNKSMYKEISDFIDELRSKGF